MTIMDLRDPIYARTNRVLFDIFDERRRQDAKWGEQKHPDGNTDGMHKKLEIPNVERAQFLCEASRLLGKLTWAHILVEEVCEAIDEDENRDPLKLREELVQVAAVACAWVEAIDKRTASDGV